MDALTFLSQSDKAKPQPFYVLHGDESFLKRQALLALRKLVLGEDDGFGTSTHPGDKASWGSVIVDVQTLPFLAPRRLVIVEQADPFVTKERAKLEKFVADLPNKGEVKGVLVLDLQSFAANTNLAKKTPDANVILCKAMESSQLPHWCANWCATQYKKSIDARAARLLVDLIGADMALLDKELEKLAIYAGSAPRIDARDVDQLVGRSRTENTFEIFALIGAGKASEALTFLARLLDQGEEPMKLLGAFSYKIRQLAQTTRLESQGVSLGEAMTKAGIPNFRGARDPAEQMLRHLGRRRLDRLYDWLLETDQGMKGGSALPPAMLLERLVVRLARTRA